MSIDVTSWELTEELRKFSDWQPDAHNKFSAQVGFSLGYLLRKLPPEIDFNDDIYKLTVDRQSRKMWRSSYARALENRKGRGLVQSWKFKSCQADTPENAACKLCVELFKQGIL